MKVYVDGDSQIASGVTVKEGEEINIEPKKLPAGQALDRWNIGKKICKSNYGYSLLYVINSDDAENGTIHISYTTKPE